MSAATGSFDFNEFVFLVVSFEAYANSSSSLIIKFWFLNLLFARILRVKVGIAL